MAVIASPAQFYNAIRDGLDALIPQTTSWRLESDPDIVQRNKSYLVFESDRAYLEFVKDDFDTFWHGYYDIKPEFQFPNAYVIVLKFEKWINYGQMIRVGTCTRLVTAVTDKRGGTRGGWANEWQTHSFNAEDPLEEEIPYSVTASLQKLSSRSKEFAVPLGAAVNANYWDQRNGMFRMSRSKLYSLPEARQAVSDLWASLLPENRPRPVVNNGNGYYIQVQAMQKTFEGRQIVAYSIVYVSSVNEALGAWKTVRNPELVNPYDSTDRREYNKQFTMRVYLYGLIDTPLRIPLEDVNLRRLLPATPNLEFLLENFKIRPHENYEQVMVDDLSDEAWSGNVSEVSDALLRLLVA